jgi:DNA-directed RNA polymerase specialized sigma subunit
VISQETRDKRVIERRLAGETCQEIAERYGITAARVSQISAPSFYRHIEKKRDN